MPADSLHIRQTAAELNALLSGGRIDKITMPESDEIVLFIHNRGNHALVLSANPSLPRLHVTAHAPKNNPLTAPSFLMHLRKRIGGAVIESITPEPGERIVRFALRARGELGYEEKRTLICEILGKYANIVLVNEDGKISECIKHISPSSSDKRPVLPGLPYTVPPAQDKIDIFCPERLRALLDGFTGGKIDGFILAGAAGLAPSTINGIVTSVLGSVYADTLTNAQKDELAAAFDAARLLAAVRPVLRKDENGKTDFWIAPFWHEGEYTFFPTLNEAMDAYYSDLDRERRLQEKAHVPKTAVKNAIARTEKKLKLFLSRRNEAADAETDRLFGELITANMYKLKQGMESFTAENYYADPPALVRIPLQADKSPQYNAQAYYKRYAKKKKTLAVVREQIEQAENDLEYFHSVFDSFSYTDEAGLEEIAAELQAAGLIRAYKTKNKKAKELPGEQITFHGCVIRWGKTNYQNDRITRGARPDDIWLHTQKTHGSHVVVSGEHISNEVLLRAAEIAAYYSKARLADNVPVDYTRKKFVNKPKGAAPGKVFYTDYKTLFVTPRG